MPQDRRSQAERQEIVPADSPGEQVGSQMLIFSIMEDNTHRKIKLELPVVAIIPPPKKKQQEFFVGQLVRKVLSVSSGTSKPNYLCTSRLDITFGYVLWKNWQQGGRMKWDSKPSLYLLLYLLVLSPLFAF